MIDLNSLASIAETASGVIGAAVAIWKFFIAPHRKFKVATLKKLNDLENRVKILETDTNKFEQILQDEIETVQKDVQREFEYTKEEAAKLGQTLKEHIEKVDNKNDKLLDLIIKYFSEKE